MIHPYQRRVTVADSFPPSHSRRASRCADSHVNGRAMYIGISRNTDTQTDSMIVSAFIVVCGNSKSLQPHFRCFQVGIHNSRRTQCSLRVVSRCAQSSQIRHRTDKEEAQQGVAGATRYHGLRQSFGVIQTLVFVVGVLSPAGASTSAFSGRIIVSASVVTSRVSAIRRPLCGSPS